jgi:DNA topoisomerase-1
VNRYLAETSGLTITAKDFRTWWGTVSAATLLRDAEPPGTKAAARRTILDTLDNVAGELGNTRAVCRSCYVHPGVLGAFGIGGLRAGADLTAAPIAGLTEDEAWTVAFLQTASQRPARARPAPRRPRPGTAAA